MNSSSPLDAGAAFMLRVTTYRSSILRSLNRLDIMALHTFYEDAMSFSSRCFSVVNCTEEKDFPLSTLVFYAVFKRLTRIALNSF